MPTPAWPTAILWMDYMSNGVSHESIAKLFNLTPDELNRLVLDGVITRNGKDDYSLAVAVRDYIQYLKSPRLLNQQQVAEYLDMSDRNVRELLDKLKMHNRTHNIDDIRIAYIRHLREQAAGRSAQGDLDLATERALLAKEQRERIALQNAVTRQEYGPIEELQTGLADCLAQIASQLESIPGKLKKRSDALTPSDLNLVREIIVDARNTISNLNIDWFGEKSSMETESDVAESSE